MSCRGLGEQLEAVSVFTIRAHKRFAVCRKVPLGKPGCRDVDGLLIELSLDGCRISHGAAPDHFAIEDKLVLRIADAAPIEAWVRWVNEGTIGLRFAQPLHNAGLEELVRLCRVPAEPLRAYGT